MTAYKTSGKSQAAFELMYARMADDVLNSASVDVGEWQAKKGVNSETLEVTHARVEVPIPAYIEDWQWMTQANVPWAEDHFLERVGGKPLNPPPSSDWWPYAVAGNADHKANEKFSHTYPERFWPRMANVGNKTDMGRQIYVPHVGIRFEYGDYDGLIQILQDNLYTRQAYLPIWFPEDISAANNGERVPCSLGYHFLFRNGKMDVEYHIRSCDMVRHFRDDVYMAGRLVQDIIWKLGLDIETHQPGKLIMNIGSLHAFPPDKHGLSRVVENAMKAYNKHLMERL